jgi:hypothetical protein
MFDLIEELKKIAQALQAQNLAYALCGGLAVGIYAEPRATVDIDLVVSPADLGRIIATLEPLGFEKMSEIMPLGHGAMPIQRLVKFVKGEPEVLILDLCMPEREAHPRVWKDWIRADLEQVKIWILSPEGLIEMKKSRSSAKDLADIQALEKKCQ